MENIQDFQEGTGLPWVNQACVLRRKLLLGCSGLKAKPLRHSKSEIQFDRKEKKVK